MDQNLALETFELSKYFRKDKIQVPVLSKLTLNVPTGKVFGFLGPNGAGKSTTIKLLLRFIHPDEGHIKIFGDDINTTDNRNTIGYLSETPCIQENLTPKEAITLFGRLSDMRKNQILETGDKLLHKLNLYESRNVMIKKFSKGMKQRLGMVCALIHNPQLIIFDEPMSGLDPLGRHLVKNILIEMRNEGKTIFFSSHILSDIEELCDLIAIVHKGHLLYSGELSSFTQNSGLEEKFVQLIQENDNENN